MNDFPKFIDKTGQFNDKPCEGQRTVKPVFLYMGSHGGLAPGI